MFLFKHGSRRAVQAIQTHTTQRFASKISIPFQPPPVPIIEKCPSPTCLCREPPSGLDIEREQNINGSMAAYAEQVLISTGRDDWKSRTEDEEDAVLVNQLKKNLTRGGKFVDPYHNILITNSSFPPTPSTRRSTPNPGKDPSSSTSTTDSASAFLLPSFQYIPSIPTTNPSSIETFIKAFLLPPKLHNAHSRLNRAEQNILLREAELQAQFPGARDVDEILILICGHGGRDDRCGKLGPLLREEFQEKLQRQNIPLSHSPPPLEAEVVDTAVEGYVPTARVGLISHIGGHKWAGNVIVYIPPSFERNSLAGKGIWYGRVGPEHVEGIVQKTVLEGKVIKELFRGGIDRSGEIIRL
ncbi:hypothetical protein M409DRAFT_65660 [Zasmidium cellare ATCC 36951]|uniref:Altered inheritance of mitochondria protein 32 n=1 Tax=Zasmidium cellare ATCC 36951 TaxID=1080233 RepID=A0A6A6CLQ1_ZASCE|nr:uncharacterized protein M409DRAFT_65660 [Zasmidium cellare ATCC 36951]KAF2168157.1 hypothetical protein M409DRAFT_65660 [Zasmidium cellare ATCC 36951]